MVKTEAKNCDSKPYQPIRTFEQPQQPASDVAGEISAQFNVQ